MFPLHLKLRKTLGGHLKTAHGNTDNWEKPSNITKKFKRSHEVVLRIDISQKVLSHIGVT